MKDLSFFLFKNYLGAKMKKGVRNFCNSDNSTTTLNQHDDHTPQDQRQRTLEEMILQLQMEEEIAKQEKLNKYNVRGRMSCVNNSDILRSARNALNQYPRFSLDGKDAMYRSSFRNLNGRKSVGCDHEDYNIMGSKFEKSNLCMPKDLAREKNNVVWCKPGVVAKLMGLEAMPVVARARSTSRKLVCDDQKMKCCIVKGQNLRRKAERHEMERRIVMENVRNSSSCDIGAGRRSGGGGKIISSSCSKSRNQYREMRPAMAVDDDRQPQNNNVVGRGWPTRRFR